MFESTGIYLDYLGGSGNYSRGYNKCK